MNLDRIDSNQESNPDGFFDYVEGYTVQPSNGKSSFRWPNRLAAISKRK